LKQTYNIYGIDYECPETPSVIDGSQFANCEQYFRRTEVPSSFEDLEFDEDGNAVYDDDHIEFITKEVDKIKNGYWFMNDGEPTYINGLHYFYLNYWTLENGDMPDYRDVDRRYFYFQEYCEADMQCYGIIRIKKRREGATSQATCYLVWKAITQKKSFCGIISKTGKDASDAFIYMVMNGYRNLPVFLKPRVEDEDTKTELVFRKKKDKRKAKVRDKGQIYDSDIGLESKINFKNTALNSYDSGRVSALLMDEAGKWPKEVAVNQYWPIVKKTLTRGAIKVGFCLIPSTANDAKSGGEPYKMLFEQSNQFKDSSTATGLYRYFCPAYDGYEGFIDRHGKSIIDEPTEEQAKYIKQRYGLKIVSGAKDYLLKQRQLLSDDKKALSEEIRMNPFDENEAFMIDQRKCYFNAEKIYNQIDFLKEERIPIRKVRLIWKDDKTVDWVDDKDGPWKVYKFPPNGESNKVLESDGIKIPANTHKYVSGIDPFKSSVISGKGSMGACFVFERLDMSDPSNTCMPIAEYIDRPRLKSMFHDEMLKASIYWGYKACYENDVGDDFVDYFSNKGFKGYLMKTPESAIDKNRKRNVSKFGVTSGDAFALARQLDTCITYIENHCEKIVFSELLEELLQYDHEHRTIYDRSVAFMISLLSGVSLESKRQDKVSASIPIRTFKLTT
jgi:hypothetical protein